MAEIDLDAQRGRIVISFYPAEEDGYLRVASVFEEAPGNGSPQFEGYVYAPEHVSALYESGDRAVCEEAAEAWLNRREE